MFLSHSLLYFIFVCYERVHIQLDSGYRDILHTPPYRQPPEPAPPVPMSHPSMRPRRAAAARTNAAIDASLRVEAQTTRLGKMKKI